MKMTQWLCISLISLASGLVNFKALTQTTVSSDILEKIQLDTSRISPEGLTGQPDGLRSVMYEFCVPNDPKAMAEVQGIDPEIQFFPHSPGRIGCQKEEILAINSTHNPHWQEILLQLASLDYIKQIQEFYGE